MYKKILAFVIIALVMFTMVSCTDQPAVEKPDVPEGTQEIAPDGNSGAQEGSGTEDAGNQSPVVENVFGGDTPVSNDGEGSAPQGNSAPSNNGTTDTNVSDGHEGSGVTGSTPSSGSNSQTSTDSNNVGTIPTVPEKTEDCTYEEYHAMTPEAQQQFFAKFESVEKFFDWYNAAKAQYEKENEAIEIGDGQIDLGEVLGGEK